MRTAVPVPHAYRLFHHGPTTLITTAHGSTRNAMAAAWVMPLDFDPPKSAAVIAADTFTRSLLEASGECVLQAPTTAQVELTHALGSCSGRDGDKLSRLQVATEPASLVRAPLIQGCAAWIECRLLPEPELQARHDLFVLQGIAAWAEDALWHGGARHFAAHGPRTIHHEKGGAFFATGERVAVPR